MIIQFILYFQLFAQSLIDFQYYILILNELEMIQLIQQFMNNKKLNNKEKNLMMKCINSDEIFEKHM